MAQPSPKSGILVLLNGLLLTAIGFILGLGLENRWLTAVDGRFFYITDVLQFDVGPAVMAFGAGWIVSGLHPLRKWYLYSVTAGLLISTTSFTLSAYFPLESYMLSSTLLSLTWAVGPALLTSGVVSAVIINRRVSMHGVKIAPNPHENSLSLAALLALYLPLLPVVLSQVFFTRYVLPALITWVFWHFFADRLTSYLLMRRVRGSSTVKLVAVEPPSPEETTLMNVVSRSYYPMAFGLGVTTTVTSILDLLGIEIFGGDPFAATAGAALASIVAISLGSLYVGPVLWLYEDLGIRVFDETKKVMETPRIHSLADEMIEIYTFIFSPIGLTFSVANGDIILALTLLALAIHLLLTISMTTTYLYIRFSAKPHILNVLKRLSAKGVITQYRPP